MTNSNARTVKMTTRTANLSDVNSRITPRLSVGDKVWVITDDFQKEVYEFSRGGIALKFAERMGLTVERS